MKILPDNRLIAHGTVAGSLFTAVSLFTAAIVFTVNLRNDATASRLADADHEIRLRGLEEMRGDLKAVQTDVSWIRDYFDPDRQHKTAATKP